MKTIAEPAGGMLSDRKAGTQPLWEGIKGVTNRPERERELGLGKWTEEQGRSAEEIRQSLPTAPPRELDLTVERPIWPLYAALALALMAGMGWLWQMWLADAPVGGLAAPISVSPEPAVIEAIPDGASVRIEVVHGTDGRVTFDGIDYGLSPTDVPLPEAGGIARPLCVASQCREVTREQLTATGNAYFFDRRPE